MATQALTPLSHPSHFPAPGADSSARLAFDLALNIQPVDKLAAAYGLTKQDIKARLMQDVQFSRQFIEYRKLWSSALKAADRVKLKAAVMAEDGLIDLWRMYVNADLNPAVRLDIHKHLTRLADVEPKRDESLGGPQFSLTLNLGGAAEPMVIEHAPSDDGDGDQYDDGQFLEAA